jgi:hypothetical protein
MSGRLEHLVLLILCLPTLVTLVFFLAMVGHRFATRRRQRVQSGFPDFVVADRGTEIHFIPLGSRHTLDPSTNCRCRPLRTANYRRCGAHVTYVDHRCLPAQTPAAQR